MSIGRRVEMNTIVKIALGVIGCAVYASIDVCAGIVADKHSVVETLEIENKELKRLLKLAVRDIGKMKSCEEFPFCVGCPKANEPYCECRHHDEAMKLLGDVENENG